MDSTRWLFRFLFAYNVAVGGERASTVRRRLAGKICARCKRPLPPPHRPGERVCGKCDPKRRVLMTFQERYGWWVSFLEEDCKTSLPRKLRLASDQKIRDMYARFAEPDPDGDSQLERALSIGRGGIWLLLTDEQYRKLLQTR